MFSLPALLFLEIRSCPKITPLMSCRYCRAVGLVFSPLNFPRCWQNWFSTASELIIAGIIDQPLEFVRGLDIAAQIQDCMIGDLPCIPWRARFFFFVNCILGTFIDVMFPFQEP